jgi:hypothetical protein
MGESACQQRYDERMAQRMPTTSGLSQLSGWAEVRCRACIGGIFLSTECAVAQ